MGYTHYFNNVPTTNEQWNSFTTDVQTVIDNTKIPLNIVINKDYLKINGLADDIHEDLFIRRDSDKWGFCKTARKPYDEIVCAVLLIYSHYVGPEVDLGSDGDLDDYGWSKARDIVRRLFNIEIDDSFLKD